MNELKSKILSFSRREPIELPELGESGSLTIRGISIAERERLSAATRKARETSNSHGLQALMVALFLGNKDGARVFDDESIKDLEALDAIVSERVANAGLRFNELEATPNAKKA